MPAAAVIRGGLALFGMIGRKGSVGGFFCWFYNFVGSTRKVNRDEKTTSLRGDSGIPSVRIKSLDIRRNFSRRRRLSGSKLTLRDESMGIEWD